MPQEGSGLQEQQLDAPAMPSALSARGALRLCKAPVKAVSRLSEGTGVCLNRFSLGRERAVPVACGSLEQVHSVVLYQHKPVARQVQGEACCKGRGFGMSGSELRLQYSVSSEVFGKEDTNPR